MPLRYWSMWFFGLAVAVDAFYVILTPIWIGLRGAAWLAEFRAAGGADERVDRGLGASRTTVYRASSIG